MKIRQVHEITPHLLSQENEPIAIEDSGHLLGYFYPVSYQQTPQKMTEKWERLDQIINQAAQESGLDRESLIDILDPRNSFPFESQ